MLILHDDNRGCIWRQWNHCKLRNRDLLTWHRRCSEWGRLRHRHWWLLLYLCKWLTETAILVATDAADGGSTITVCASIIGVEVIWALLVLAFQPMRCPRYQLTDHLLSACVISILVVFIVMQVLRFFGFVCSVVCGPFGLPFLS